MKIRRTLGAAAVALSVAVGGTFASASLVQAAPAVQTARIVLAGQFCKGTDLGKVVTADNGKTVKCQSVDGYNRWVIK